MCKKLVLAALLVAGGLFVYKKVEHRFCKKDTSLEAQIAELKQTLASTDDEIRPLLQEIAEREVDKKHLDRDIKDIEVRHVENAKLLQAKRDILKREANLVAAGEKSEGLRRAEKDLDSLKEAFKRCRNELKAKKELLAAQEETIAARRAEVDAYLIERRELETELAQIEAQLAKVRAEEIKSKITFNQTKLSQLKKRAAEISKKVEVKERTMQEEARVFGKKPAQPEVKTQDLVKEVDDLLNGEGK